MTRTSVIRQPSNSPIVVIRKALILICEGAPDTAAAAAILNQFIFWTDVRLAHMDQADYHNFAEEREAEADHRPAVRMDDSLWIYKTQEDLQAELLNVFGRNKIIDNLAWLVKQGYLHRRANPRYRWDKTAQYMLETGLVQSRLDALPSFKTKPSNRRNQRIESSQSKDREAGNKPAIPLTTSKTTAEGGAENDLTGGVFAFYEGNFSLITPYIKDSLTDLEKDYTAAWLMDAMKEAMRQGKRTLAYTEGILKRWKSEGRGEKPAGKTGNKKGSKAADPWLDSEGNSLFNE